MTESITDGATDGQVAWRTAVGALILAWLLARHPEHSDDELERLVVLIRAGIGHQPIGDPLIPHFEGAYRMALLALDEEPPPT